MVLSGLLDEFCVQKFIKLVLKYIFSVTIQQCTKLFQILHGHHPFNEEIYPFNPKSLVIKRKMTRRQMGLEQKPK